VKTSGAFLLQVRLEGGPDDGPGRSPKAPVSLQWRIREIGCPYETLISFDLDAQPAGLASSTNEWVWRQGSHYERQLLQVP